VTKINFQCTLADYQEANRGHVAARRSRKFVWTWRLMLVAAVLLVVFPLLLLLRPKTSGPASPLLLFGVGLASWLPFIIMFMWLVLLATSRTGSPRQRYRDVTREAAGHVAWAWLPFVLAIIATPLLANSIATQSTTQPTAGNGWVDMLVPFIPWLLVFGFLWFFVFRRLTRRMYMAQPSLMRPKTLELSDDEATVSDELSRLTYKWPAFVRFIETRNLFLMYVSEVMFHIVPKRAFDSQCELDEFRQKLREWADARSQGFPVLPAISTTTATAGR
jgi:hypothetical protein